MADFHIQLNDNDLSRLRLRLTMYGAWVGECVHSDPSLVPSVGDSASVVLASQTFVGTVVRVATLEDMSYDTLIVGGGGGLSTLLGPLQLVAPSVSDVLSAALSGTGESLSSTVLPSVLQTQLQSWRRPSRTLGRELDAVCAALPSGSTWRILRDGTVWVGQDPEAGTGQAVVQDYDVMSWDASQGLVVIAAEDPTVIPGQTWPDVPGVIGTVVHDVTPDATRSELYVADPEDREVGTFDALLPQPDMLAFYPYRVLSQNADGTLELKTTDQRLPDLSRCPVRYGIPGTTGTIPSGSIVVVGFAGGNSQDPYVASWSSGTATNLAVQAGTLLELGSSPATSFVSLSSLVAGQLSAISASIVNIAAAVNTLAPGSVTVIYGVTTPVGSTAATKVKAT